MASLLDNLFIYLFFLCLKALTREVSLVVGTFEPSQQQRITSGLIKTNFKLTRWHSAHVIKPQILTTEEYNKTSCEQPQEVH